MNTLFGRTAGWIAAAALFAAATHSPGVALAAGGAAGLLCGGPASRETGKAAGFLLRFAVVLLGFGMRLDTVLRVGSASVVITLVSITATILLGWWLGRLFSVDRELSLLVSSGTAICGGSAVAAMAPVIGASQAHTAVALAIVFALNAVALFVFPILGHCLGLTEEQFGLWSALAIHDTSSVVGAASVYGARACAIATTVKLTRALWILPLSCAGVWAMHSNAKIRMPWFLAGFLAAAAAASLMPNFGTCWTGLAVAGKRAMVATLFLVGASLRREDLARIGARPLAAGVVLWVAAATISAVAIRMDWCSVAFD